MDISKATGDSRPESYNIVPDSIKLGDVIPSDTYWMERRKWLMSILDWEFGQLYRKVVETHNWQGKIQAKILNEIFSRTRDTHIILGNMAGHPQTFCVLGFFWPPKKQDPQVPLFS